jgi:hypothetical protein
MLLCRDGLLLRLLLRRCSPADQHLGRRVEHFNTVVAHHRACPKQRAQLHTMRPKS